MSESKRENLSGGGRLQERGVAACMRCDASTPAASQTEYTQKDVAGEKNMTSQPAASSMPKPGTDEFAAECRKLDHRSLGYRVVKRAFDIAISGVAVVVGFIPGVLLSAAIAADTKGLPIYSQIRVGKDGRPFRLYKFRSMVADADNVEKYLTPEQLEVWQRERKVDDDPRITRLGGIIRKTSLDELPQFINVLFGQISVIGPRAITYDELGEFGEDAPLLLSVDPGITGAWQCGPRNQATFENGQRQNIELGYARNASLPTDVSIFFKTFGVMFGKNRTGK